MFIKSETNAAASTAMAFVTYALVPYLGILFCPGAFLMGTIALVRADRGSKLNDRRRAATSIVLGVALFGVHVFLWWILYKIPDWSQI
jgi:hypothetical protein